MYYLVGCYSIVLDPVFNAESDGDKYRKMAQTDGVPPFFPLVIFNWSGTALVPYRCEKFTPRRRSQARSRNYRQNADEKSLRRHLFRLIKIYISFLYWTFPRSLIRLSSLYISIYSCTSPPTHQTSKVVPRRPRSHNRLGGGAAAIAASSLSLSGSPTERR